MDLVNCLLVVLWVCGALYQFKKEAFRIAAYKFISAEERGWRTVEAAVLCVGLWPALWVVRLWGERNGKT